MPKFAVKVATRKGTKKVEVYAVDAKAASLIGGRQGRVVSAKREYGIDIIPGMSDSERYNWMLRMSSMIGSKLPQGESLRLMAANFTGNIRKASSAMLDRIESGMTLPDAMEQDRKNFPAMTTALVKAGVATGETWRALKEAAEFERKMANTSKGALKQVRSAIGSFVIAYGLVLGTHYEFGPQILNNGMFKNMKGVDVETPKMIGNWMVGSMTVLAIVFTLFILLGSVGKWVAPVAADWLIMKLPFYRDLVLARNNHVTLYKLSLLINSGVRIEEALGLAEESAPRGALKADLRRAREAVRSGGKDWASVMNTLHETDRAALATSPDRKDIARTLDALASQYADLYISRIEFAGPVLESISALFMAGGGFLIFEETVMPMLQMAAAVK